MLSPAGVKDTWASMFKKIKIEYVLTALLVLVAIFFIMGKRISLKRLNNNYQNSVNTMEENFRTLYLSKHLRVLSHNLNIHGGRHFLTKNEEDEEKFKENHKAFYSTIKTLEGSPAFVTNRSRQNLELLKNIQHEKTSFFYENINRSFKEKQVLLLSPQVRERNEELRYWLDHLIENEIKYNNKVREEILEYKDQVIGENNLISLFLILIAVSFAVIVFKLSRMLRLAHKDALGAIQSRDDILAIVSHDLKNPLSSISLNTDLMIKKMKRDQDEMMLKGLNNTKNAVETMKELIQDLLEQAKLEADKVELNIRKETFQDVLKEAEELLAPLSQSKSIEFVNHVPKETIEVKVDIKRLKQILSNLLSNAVKFSRKGEKVEVWASVKGSELKVSVQDHGLGIEEKDLPHVFRSFLAGQGHSKERHRFRSLYRQRAG